MNSIQSYAVCLIAIAFTINATAAPPNTVVLDGRPIEYDAGELRGINPNPANNFGPGNVITNLFVTWDAQYLYLALQGREVNDKLTIMLDVDPGQGTGASSTTNWTSSDPAQASFIKYNDVGWNAAETSTSAAAFGLDYQIASEGFYNNILRIRYNGIVAPDTNNVDPLLDSGNGSIPLGTPVDMVVLANASDDPLKGFEARIPWSVLFASNLFGTVTNIVPDGAKLRMLAVLHNNDPSSAYSSDGIIPFQANIAASYTNGIWTTADYIDVLIDQDHDGAPDVAAGDVNGPYLSSLSGVQARRQVYASFNEPVLPGTVTTLGNWLVNEQGVSGVTVVATNAVLLTLTNDLPAATSLVKVEAAGIQDPAGNFRTSVLYFNPASSGIETSVTVRFLLNKNSGFGSVLGGTNPRATSNFFVNGSSGPLEWGYPPATSSPLSSLNATQYYRDVMFPPGTPVTVRYKYSGILDNGSEATTNNNYEAVRMSDFGEAARILTMPLDGSSLVVTDYLGAAAAPYRVPGNGTNELALLLDPRRGDAGVRQNARVKFRLDLSQRNVGGITRVMLLGSDPLRGFNYHPNFYGGFTGLGDYPGSVDVGWDAGGLEMFDDGVSGGDDVAGDFIYTRICDFTTDGLLSGVSLVGGDGSTPPFLGGWVDGRSPRSFDYKFAVYKAGTTESYVSPGGANLTYYLGASETNATMPTHLWANEGLPPPPPTNSPTMMSIQFSNTQRVVTFEGTDLSHGVRISTNLNAGWLDFGTRAITSSVPSQWRATINDAQDVEHYLAFSGLPKTFYGAWWSPNPVPLTGANLTVYYRQHSRALTGVRNVQISGGLFNGWSQSPMTFIGDGVWKFDYTVPAVTNPAGYQFKFRAFNGSPFYGYNDSTGAGAGDNYILYQGSVRATWSPEVATNGEVLNIYYNSSTGPFTNATQINAWLGYGEPWSGSPVPMTNIAAGQWLTAVVVPTNATHSVNFVFNNGPAGAGTGWDSENDNGGRRWTVFIAQP